MSTRTGVAGLIFDVDGTLVDSNELHAEAWAEAFREEGHEISVQQIRPHIGKGGDLLVPDLLQAAEMRAIGAKVRSRRKDLFKREYMPRVRPFPRVKESIRALREMGIRIVLASSSKKEEVAHHIETLGIEEWIDGSTSADDAEFSKPSPEIFHAALDKIPAPKSRTAIVGDTPYDILAAHRASTPIVAVRCGGFSDDSLSKAEWIADDVPDLVKRISEIDEYFRRNR